MFDVAIFGGKRLETVPVKFSELEKEFLQKVGESEDRPLGYVVRELALRGMVEYLKDHQIRADLGELENLLEKSKLDKAVEKHDSFVFLNKPVKKLGNGENPPTEAEIRKKTRKTG